MLRKKVRLVARVREHKDEHDIDCACANGRRGGATEC